MVSFLGIFKSAPKPAQPPVQKVMCHFGRPASAPDMSITPGNSKPYMMYRSQAESDERVVAVQMAPGSKTDAGVYANKLNEVIALLTHTKEPMKVVIDWKTVHIPAYDVGSTVDADCNVDALIPLKAYGLDPQDSLVEGTDEKFHALSQFVEDMEGGVEDFEVFFKQRLHAYEAQKQLVAEFKQLDLSKEARSVLDLQDYIDATDIERSRVILDEADLFDAQSTLMDSGVVQLLEYKAALLRKGVDRHVLTKEAWNWLQDQVPVADDLQASHVEIEKILAVKEALDSVDLSDLARTSVTYDTIKTFLQESSAPHTKTQLKGYFTEERGALWLPYSQLDLTYKPMGDLSLNDKQIQTQLRKLGLSKEKTTSKIIYQAKADERIQSMVKGNVHDTESYVKRLKDIILSYSEDKLSSIRQSQDT